MPVGWLLDATVFPEYHDELVAAIQRAGHNVKSINAPDPPYRWDDAPSAYRKAFPAGACVIAHADIDLVTRIRRDALWTPGVFASVERFHCSDYYAHFGQFLLNRDHEFLPFAELARRRDSLFDKYGRDGRIFVRPDSPLKLFTGMLASHATFAKDLDFMAFYEFPVESPVVVSSPKSIAKEWRFVIVDHAIVASSQYKDGDTLKSIAGATAEAHALVEQILSVNYAPDPVWMIDIGQTTDGHYHLLEIGGFSFCNLYACDKDAVVRAVSQVTQRVHGQNHAS